MQIESDIQNGSILISDLLLQISGLHMFFVGIFILILNHFYQGKNLEDKITCASGGRASGDGPVTHPVHHQDCIVMECVVPGLSIVSVGTVS